MNVSLCRFFRVSGWLVLAAAALLLSSCKKNAVVPDRSTPISERVKIFPDYTDIVIPPNIAPLNFMVRADGEAFVCELSADGHRLVAGAGADGKIEFDEAAWNRLLQDCKGKSLTAALYVQRQGKWLAYPHYHIQIAQEPVDAFLSYRLIEPGFELYRQVGLYQRNLTNFDVRTIYENNRKYDEKQNHCVNCHNYQNYSTQRMMFHVRGAMGGTVFVENGKVVKMNMKSDSILSNAVYPSWHPRRNWVAFSTNQTGQTFHLLDKEKIEVLDYGSDLIFYNADTHEISNIIKTPDQMETFPHWAPSGDRLFYCVAPTPWALHLPDSVKPMAAVEHYRDLKYNLMSIPFDEKTRTFGTPRLEYDCRSHGLSASVPRVSPDGRYVLFTLGRFGQFHIWHKSSDLYVKDLKTGKVYPLSAANSPNVDSYHSWSSNGRWIAFSSRRDDGSFTRIYFTYFDRQGRAHKAFMLPQRDPEQNFMLVKSYNVPELTRDAVRVSAAEFRKAIYGQEGTPVKYKEIRKQK